MVACHKMGVMKMGDGLFIDTVSEVSKGYPEIQYKEEQVDTVCMKLAKDPKSLDVMVMPNLYGDIVSDLCAGLIGGLGLTASGNIGKTCSVYEAVHGTAPDIAGKGLANPTALILSATMVQPVSYLDAQAHEPGFVRRKDRTSCVFSPQTEEVHNPRPWRKVRNKGIHKSDNW